MKISMAIVALTAALLLAGCGVPADSSPQLLDETALPPELADPGTTTTTTETPATAVSQPVYFFDDENLLAEIEREVPRPVAAQEVLEVLFVGPTEQESDDLLLRSSIPNNAVIVNTELSNDVLTVNLAAGSLEEIEGELQKSAIAQIVYTATGIEGIDAVLIQIDGEVRQLPTDESDSHEDQPVRRADYRSFDRQFLEEEESTGNS
jgi:spore germination protein GerM